MIAPEHPAQTRLAGQSVNGYRVEIENISVKSDPHEITGKLVDTTGKKRPSIPFVLDTYPQHIADPAGLQEILQEFGRYSGDGTPIKFRYVPVSN